jgi:hypothetical protein
MRAKEFITESGFPAGQEDATPDMISHPSLDNSSPYAPWRFSGHFLAGADGKNPYEHMPDREGPSGQALVTVAYTNAEDAMIKQAEKAFGQKAHRKALTSRGSKEPNDINRNSPVKSFAGYETKSKKKK